VRVQHRHIIYVQGYDPRGLAQYYRMFRTELRKFGRLYQLTATISRPQGAPTARPRPGPSRPRPEDWQTRTSYDFLRFEDLIQRDLAAPIWRTVFHAVWIYWRLVFAAPLRGSGRRTGALRPSSPIRISCCCSKPCAPLGIAFGVRERGLKRSAFPTRSASPRRPPCSSPARHRAEIHRKPDLSALSAVRHDLDLGILAPPAAGMGPAHRPLRAASRQGRRKATPRKSSSSATVRDRSWASKCWRARSSSIPRSAGTARASCC
jgi:hypothetical protein